MKKIILSISVFILMIYCFPIYIEASNIKEEYNLNVSSYVQMINTRDSGTLYDGYLEFDDEIIYVNNVNVLTPNGTSFIVYETLNDFSQELIDYYNLIYDSKFPNATRLSSATARYNCHSYAWYNQSSSNVYWMDSPLSYYDSSDMSYQTVTTPRRGDIICYYDDKGTPNDLSDDENIHSGIVVNYDSSLASNNVCGNSNKVTVKSKWGPAGLYVHRGDECPYTSSNNGEADYVKYYRPRTNETITPSNPQTNATQTIERNYSVTQYYNITTNYALYDLNISIEKTHGFEITSTYPLDVRLYDEHMQLISINNTNTYTNQTYKVAFSYTFSKDLHYYLRVAFSGNNNGIINTKITNPHVHIYTHDYTWVNYLRHTAECTCGATKQEMHVSDGVPISSGSPYCTCIECGGLTLTSVNCPEINEEIEINESSQQNNYNIPLSLIKKEETLIDSEESIE